jgi:hypothetical protein
MWVLQAMRPGTVAVADGDTWIIDLTALSGTGALPPATEDFVIAGTLDNPTQTFTETVTDDAGNTDSGNTLPLDVDNQAPSITVAGTLAVTTNNVGPANAAITDGVTYSAGTVTIPDGDTWTVDLTALTGNAALSPGIEDFVIAGALDNPAQTFTETVTDDAGNTNSGNTASLDVDNEAPSITTAGSLIVSTNNVGPAGNAAITDGVTYSAGTVSIPDGDTWLVNLATLTGTATLPPATEDFVIAGTLDNPAQTFTEIVTDDAGNMNSGNTLPLNVDNEAPSITAAGSLTVSTNNVGPAGNAAITDGVTYSAGTIAIPDSDTWTVDLTALTGNAALPPATEDFVIAGALDNAAQTFTETVTDDAGNTGSGLTLGLDVDNELPTVIVTITQESTPAGIGDWINITVNTDADAANVDADLAAAGFTGQADNQALTQAATFWYYNFTVDAGTYDGMNTINVDVVDDAGNADNNNTESAIWDDEAPTPTVIITQESTPAGIGKYINITATIQGDDAVSVDIDLAAFTGQVDNTAMMYNTSTSTWYYNFTVAVGTLDSTAITINVDATDDAGNTALNNSQTADADENLPTIISVIVSDPLISDIDAGGVFDVRIAFSESMDMGATPVIVFENPGLFFTLTPSTNDWISATEFRQNYTITDDEEDVSIIDINVTAGQDEAGNVMVYDVTADVFDVDTQNPWVTIFVSDILITDADAGSTFYVNCSFSENMNNGIIPSVYFVPDVEVSGTLTFVSGVWNPNNDWYNVSYTIADIDEEQLGVDVGLSGAQDDAGNPQVPDPFTFWDAFNVDTVNPTVTSVTINDILITDSDAGGMLNITIDYSEPMDTSVNPTLTFSPDIVASGTLIFVSSDWYDSTHYRVNYTIADVNETQLNVDITADGAQNVGGVPQASYTEVDALDVDTLNPTVVSVTIDDILITDSDAGGILNITVEYSESMDTGVDPTLTFTPDIVTSGTITFTSSDWYDSTHYRVNYTIADVNEEQLDVDIDINGAQDAAGNAQVVYSEIDAFDVDTLNPTVVGVTIDDIQITDSDAGSILNITIEYSEPMNTSVNPTLTFSPNIVVSGTLTFVSSDWYDSTHYRVNYTIADVNETLLDVDINADGAQNVAGDTQVFYTEIDALDVDTMNPTVVGVTIDDILITDSDAEGMLNITVEYSEPMNTGVDPTLTFAPDVEGSGTLTFSSSDWFHSTHYRVNYTIADMNEEHLDVNITADGAQNVAGNSQITYTETDAFDVDTENPTVTIIIILESTPAGIGEWVNITVTTDADATSVVGNLSDFAGQTASETFLGSGSNWYYNFTVVAGTFEGLGEINVTVTDDVGNAGYNDTETAEVDEVLPDVTITSTADMVNASYVVSATIVGADSTDVWYKVDTDTEVQLPNIGGDNYEATIDVSALSEVAHTIQIIAYDTAGNVNDLESVDITVDHTIPEVNITSTEATVHASYELTVIITDTNIDTGNLSYSIDDGTPVTLTLVSGDNYNATIDTSSLSEGQHTIKVIAYDLAGNINVSESIVITIDHSAPSVTASDLPTLVNSATLTVSGTTEPNALVEVLIDDFVVATVTADATGEFSVDISLSEGQNNVVIRATDEAGNVAETSPQIVERDTTPPIAPDLGDLPAEVTKSSLTITGTTEPGANVEILVDDVLAAGGTADANGDFSIEITLEKGEHQIQARATDGAGNTALSSVLTIKYEEEAPTDYSLYIIIVLVIIVIIILVLVLTRRRGKKEEVEGEKREEVTYEELEEAPEEGVEEPEEEVSYEKEFEELPEEELGVLEEEEVTYEEEPEEEMISEEEAPEEEVYAEEGLEFECPDCGTPVPGDVTKCPKCGAEFEEVEEGEEGEEGE